MITGPKTPKMILIASVFIWAGLVLGISFLESWLKFQAPGITTTLGVGIGRLVFFAMNKVELVLAVIILAAWWRCWQLAHHKSMFYIYGVVVVALLVQTFILLPIMDERAEMRIAGEIPPPSGLHFYYVGGEILKLGGLVVLGIYHMKFSTLISKT